MSAKKTDDKQAKLNVNEQSDAKKELIELGKSIVQDINKANNPKIELSVRGLSNVVYDKQSKTLQLGDKTAQRFFFNAGHSKKFLQTIEVAAICKNLLDVNKHASLRDVFYMAKRTIPNTKINVVDDQKESDKSIEDLEIITGFSRENLNVNANKMGSVAGKVVIEDSGDTIDWSKLGSGGWSIPSNVENIKFKKVDAKYVIYMEKAAVWERLHEDRFWEKQNCIIMSSQGQTTRGIRRLLQRLSTEHNLPILVLTDFDSWGHYIYSVMKFGSISLAHMADEMSIPSAKFLGIRAHDIEKYGLQKHFIKLNDQDISRLKQISEYDWFKNSKEWQAEFKKMKQFGHKAEIQALSARGISFISETYLPEKIKNKDWIE
ncbi:TPA: DNA topoisomerase IV subunit A [Candidatus Woesearchaeota archaeon]|nr:DNA topoisomerase IV subunit A [Candidatus Woesearchaeota archaeon]HIH31693.1 DNA topoisomerase IV subunit A [Candidatus Woesearchaeota archaeon]HIH54956.1 DNA topoisomerase IV subunit A [Candidatus Woesearchaeota archaeon]HIJ02649.1 DNA topoisomerase IV subunit A [Candidatus Woesearchaeota archaeon]HIJ13613.1 DNA topoisomerase IV subunit A [Candidatus Woesearchaeota archaeon]